MARRKPAQIVEYPPKKIKDGAGCLIVLPGFVESLEKSRSEKLAHAVNERNYWAYALVFSGTEVHQQPNDKRLVICDFSRRHYRNDLKKVLQVALDNPRIDNSRLALFTSSISGAIAIDFFVEEEENPFKTYITISPLLGWKKYGNETQRDHLESLVKEKKIDYIPITTDHDKDNRVERVIPVSRFPEMKKIDSIKSLKEGYKTNGMHVMTHIGERDNISCPESMMEAHRLMGGDYLNAILHKNRGHYIPPKEMVETSANFTKRTL